MREVARGLHGWGLAAALLLPVLLGASAVSFAQRARADAGQPEQGRTFYVRGQQVEIPSAWLSCEKAADCVWVSASCDDVETGINAAYAQRADARLERPCRGTHMGVIRLIHRRPPRCEHGRCTRGWRTELTFPDLASPDAGSTGDKAR